MITNLYDLFYPDNLNLLWFDRLETFGSSGFSKWKQNADFCFGTSCFYLRFRSHSSYLIYIYLQFYDLIYALLRKRARQSQPNDFSLGWKNIFFLRRMWKKHLSDGAPTGRKRCEEVRKSPSFSLFGGRKLSKSGWHNERWILFGAYVLLACLRVVCLILVQEVSKSCGGGDTKGFCKCVRIVFFLRVCLAVRNMRFWGGGSDNLAKWYLDKKT